MQISIDQAVLSNGLNRIQNVVSNRPTIPVLNNIKFEAKEDHLILTATNLDLFITTKIPCTVEKEGITTLPAKKLSQIVRQFPNDQITIKTNDGHQSDISCQKSFFKISGLSDEGFPHISKLDNERVIKMSNSTLKGLIDNVSYASSLDETRQILNGILFSIRDGLLTCVSTDGRRLALMENKISYSSDLDGDSVLPNKSISELKKIVSNSGEVTISLSESFAKFETDDIIFTTKMLEGNYPNYKQVIPQSLNKMVKVNRKDLSDAVGRVSLILENTSLSIHLDIDSDNVTIKAIDNNNESSEPITAEYDGDKITISMNPTFLNECLKNILCEEITLKFNDEVSPVCLLGEEGFKYIIMPMRH